VDSGFDRGSATSPVVGGARQDESDEPVEQQRRWPVAREGLPFILPPLLVCATAVLLHWWWLAAPCGLLAGFMVFFFRDPARRVAGDERSLVAPADGRVVRCIEREDGGLSISIFLGPWDVHVNRCPLAAELVQAEHRPGRFLPAYKSQASEQNEQTRLVLRGEQATVRMSQIVGIMARRIVLWKRAGQRVGRGERIGLMKFGSRVDLEIDAPARALVSEGQRVRAAETLLAEFES
jgi:phosphatidylserine decarboxylase